MNNLEKLILVGEAAYGKNWQSPISRSLEISDRTIRNFLSENSRTPHDLSGRLLAAMEHEMNKIKSAIEIIESDKMSGDDVSIEMIVGVVDKYDYSDEMSRQHAIDAVNEAVYPITYLSDLHSVAQKFAARK